MKVLMDKKKWQIIGLGVFLAVLGIKSVWDWRVWRIEETKNYGHGPGELKPTWQMTQNWQNDIYKIRIKYPKGWSVEEGNGQVVKFSDGTETAVIKSVRVFGNLKDQEDMLIKNAGSDERLYGERQYLNTDKTSMTILTWQKFSAGETVMIQKYLAKKGDNLVTVEFFSSLADWRKNEPNFKEMAKTLVLF